MKNGGRRQGARAPTAFPRRGAIISWADRIYAEERPAVRPRIGVVRGTEIDAIDVQPIVGHHGMDAIFQTAAVVARTAGDDDPVFIFLYAQLSGSLPGGATMKRTGFADGYAACLLARTKCGQKFARFWHTEAIARGMLRTLSDDGSEKTFDGYPNWLDPDFWVDSALEDVLARADIPGAMRQVRPRQANAMSLISAASNAPRDVVALPLPPPPLPEPNEPTDLDFPWEAARADSALLHYLSTGNLGSSPFTMIPAALPIGLETRTVEDLMCNGWASEAQACHLVRKITRSDTAQATLETLLSGHLPPLAMMLACVIAAELAYKAHDLGLIKYASSELRRLVDGAAAAAGGMRAWLDAQWPDEPTFKGMLGSVGISCAANDAFWRVWIAISEPLDLPLTPDSNAAKALAHAVFVRDWILDRARVVPGPPGDRVAALARTVLHAVPSPDGEPRIEHWREVIRARRGKEIPELTLRDHASVPAAVLHAVIVISDLRLGRFMALGPLQADDSWHPEIVSTRGLVTHALDIVARHIVQRAAKATDVDEQLRLLDRAHAVAPWDDAIARSGNEARFRAERWDARLLGDLWKEANATSALAPIAEALAVAVELGEKDVARSARRRLIAAAGNGPHAWIAAARVIFARPAELAKPESIRKVEALPRPTGLDAADRTVRALYGADPAATIAELAAALVAQRDLIEYAEAEREDARHGVIGVRGPDAPARPGDDAVARACDALSARVQRPGLARTALRRAVDRHTTRSIQLTTSEAEPTVAGWLEAVRAFVAAADAELARDAAPDEAGLLAVFELTDAALDAALVDTWAAMVLRLAATLRPLIPRAGARARELARRTAAIEQEVGGAETPEARHLVDGEVRRLLADAVSISTELANDDEPERGAAAPSDAPDSFRSMTVPNEALERSRRELDTPDWAVTESLSQVTRYNLANGRRDLKLLKGTRESGVPIWELRAYDRRSGIRVLFVRAPTGPRVCAVMAKIDDAQQNRVIERVKGWLRTDG